MANGVLTLGHTNHPIERYVEYLKAYGVEYLIDVRSRPQSRFTPQYNRKRLEQSLADQGVIYSFLGNALGARPADPACYRDGVANYDLIASTEAFKNAIEKLARGATKTRIALTCAERDPIDCHRALLVGHALRPHGVMVGHIRFDGSLESQDGFDARLLKAAQGKAAASGRSPERSLFELVDEGRTTPPLEADLEAAYRIRGEQIAWRETPKPEASVG